MYCEHVHYKNIEEFCSRAPVWIDREQARRLERTSLPAWPISGAISWQRSDAKNALFAVDLIERAKTRYAFPVNDLAALVGGRSCVIGGGLTVRRWIAGPRVDSTIWTVAAKRATPGGEPEFLRHP